MANAPGALLHKSTSLARKLQKEAVQKRPSPANGQIKHPKATRQQHSDPELLATEHQEDTARRRTGDPKEVHFEPRPRLPDQTRWWLRFEKQRAPDGHRTAETVDFGIKGGPLGRANLSGRCSTPTVDRRPRLAQVLEPGFYQSKMHT